MESAAIEGGPRFNNRSLGRVDSSRLVRSLSRLALDVARFFNTGAHARRTQAAVASHAQFMLQILEGMSTAMYGLINLSLGNRPADTNVHGILSA